MQDIIEKVYQRKAGSLRKALCSAIYDEVFGPDPLRRFDSKLPAVHANVEANIEAIVDHYKDRLIQKIKDDVTAQLTQSIKDIEDRFLR